MLISLGPLPAAHRPPESQRQGVSPAILCRLAPPWEALTVTELLCSRLKRRDLLEEGGERLDWNPESRGRHDPAGAVRRPDASLQLRAGPRSLRRLGWASSPLPAPGGGRKPGVSPRWRTPRPRLCLRRLAAFSHVWSRDPSPSGQQPHYTCEAVSKPGPSTGSRGWGMGTHLGAPSPHSDSQQQVQLWSSWEMSTVPHHVLGPPGVSSWEATRGAPSCTWVAASGPPPGHPSAASPPRARRPSLGPSVPLKGVSRGPGQRQPARWEGRGTRTPGKGRFVFKLHVAVRRKNRKDITTYSIPNPGSIHGTRNSSFKGTKRN